MRFRVQSCGGEWALRSAPGEGTSVSARFPPQQAAPLAAATAGR
jgi:signal transduction histidine kinase